MTNINAGTKTEASNKKNNKNLILVIILGMVAIILVGGAYVIFNREPAEIGQPAPPIEVEKKSAIFSVVGEKGKAGESIEVGINLENQTEGNISTIEFVVSYDKNVFTNPTVKGTEILDKSSKQVSYNVIEEGKIKVVIFGLNQNNIENGNLMEINFKIKSAAQAGTSLISIEQLLAVNGQAIEVQTKAENKDIEIIK